MSLPPELKPLTTHPVPTPLYPVQPLGLDQEGVHVMANYSLSATINLAGPQTVHIDTHGDSRQEGGHLRVTLAGVLMFFTGREAALLWAEAFLAEASQLRRLLPEQVQSLRADRNVFGHPVTISVSGQRFDTYNVDQHGLDRLVIRVGQTVWVFHDRVAYDDAAAGWARVRELARLVLPKK